MCQVAGWASENNLQTYGLYFEGFVDDLKAVLDYHNVLKVILMVLENLGRESSSKEKKTKTKTREGGDLYSS